MTEPASVRRQASSSEPGQSPHDRLRLPRRSAIESLRLIYFAVPPGAFACSIATGLIWNAALVSVGVNDIGGTLMQRLIPNVSLEVATARQVALGIPLEAALLVVLGYRALRP